MQSISSGSLPQIPQGSLFLLRNGLLLAQVPENFPSFFKIILIAIPAKAIPSNKNVIINKYNSVSQAYKNAYKKCNLNDNIIVYGSFFTVSESMHGVKI